MANPPVTHWTIDKRITVSILMAVLSQCAFGIWMLSKMDSRVAQLEAYMASRSGDAVMLARMQERLEVLMEDTREIKNKLSSFEKGER